MSEARLLLVETNPAIAGRITSALQSESVEPLHVSSLADAKEALTLQQFDAILLSAPAEAPNMADELCALARSLNPPIPVLSYSQDGNSRCDAAIPCSVPLSKLASEVKRLIQTTSVSSVDHVAAGLDVFDVEGFEQQMGGDRDLMREIVSIYFEESAGQMESLREAPDTGQLQAAARVAHSIKGSLGSLHAPRARHWAQALESAATANDGGQYERCLSSLEQSVSELKPKLQDFLNA